MKEQRKSFPIKPMARVLKISRSGYYSWLNRKPSKRKVEDERFKPLIRSAHKKGRKTSGTVKIKQDLEDDGINIGRDRIDRLKKEMGLKCKQVKKYKATTNSKHNHPVAPNLLNQKFDVLEPGMVYGADITYINTDEGWLYLAGLKDFCSKEIVGYEMGARMTVELTASALRKALKYRKLKPGAIHHSDRGIQYCSGKYVRMVEEAGLRVSMSRKGNCYDNAPTESFWGSLKQELIYQRHFRTRLEAKAAIQEWIEVFYNRVRRHSSLGNIPPAVWAEKIEKKEDAA